MADSTPDKPTKNGAPKVTVGDKEVTIKRARVIMKKLAQDAAELRDDETQGAKNKRIEIANQLRTIQRQIAALEELVDVIVPADATKQWPFRIGPQEFWPGPYRLPVTVAQTLAFMIDQHKRVESNRIIDCGNAPGDSYGKELPSL